LGRSLALKYQAVYRISEASGERGRESREI
jgi:hypothetical protein